MLQWQWRHKWCHLRQSAFRIDVFDTDIQIPETYHRAQRNYLWWQAKRKFYSRSYESPLFTVESTMKLTYQTVMRSCYKPGKILLNARWDRTSPGGRRIRKAKLSKRGTKCVAVIGPQSLPSAVFPSIGYYITGFISWSNDGLLDFTV